MTRSDGAGAKKAAAKGAAKKVAGAKAVKTVPGKKAAAKKVAGAKALPAKKAAATATAAAPSANAAVRHDHAAVPLGDAAVLDRLHAVIMARKSADPAISHSARLLSRGMPKVAQKFGEEAVECLIEAVAGNRAALVGESADVLYHLLVLWVAAGMEPGEVWAELARREGVSGVAEKAARTKPVAGTSKIP